MSETESGVWSDPGEGVTAPAQRPVKRGDVEDLGGAGGPGSAEGPGCQRLVGSGVPPGIR